MTESNRFSPSDRTTLKRKHERGSYEKKIIQSILDEAFFCHLGFVRDGTPFVIPMAYARVGDVLYLHGSHASRFADVARDCQEICVTVTLLDGLVLARSALHHSMNYRSVLIVGNCALVKDNDEKFRAMQALVEHILPGRTADCRPPNESEIRRTAIVSLPIKEASAKIRSGPPDDDEADLAFPFWAGEVPLSLCPGTPVPDRTDGNMTDLSSLYLQKLKKRSKGIQ
jgi:hypothetical protein